MNGKSRSKQDGRAFVSLKNLDERRHCPRAETAEDSKTLVDSVMQAQTNVNEAGVEAEIEEVAADKGYHAAAALELAESVGHHPDLFLAWGKVRMEIWTHKINGLSTSDFVFSAKADRLYTNPE